MYYSCETMLTKQDLESIAQLIDIKLKPIKADLRKIKRDIRIGFRFFDNEHIGLVRRVDRIEDKLNLPKTF